MSGSGSDHRAAEDDSGWRRRTVLTAGLTVAAAPLVAPPAAGRTGRSLAAWTTAGLYPDPEVAPPPPLDPLAELGTGGADELRAAEELTWTTSRPGDRSTGQLPAGVPFTFRYDDFDIQELSEQIRPYHLGRLLPLTDAGVHDSHGVRMALLGGRLYDHPVAQAQYGLMLLESYRKSGDPEYLARAELQAQRLVDRRVVHRGGWFYPYPFRYQLHRAHEIYEPPWYSMMAQGQALSLLCRLSTVTGKPAWRTAADATFASYLVTPVAGRPWGVYVVNGYLWFEEYPNPGAVRGDRTYNGHTFAAYGLWDYWMVTKSELALALLRGGLTTTRDVYLDVRNRHWRSKYCLAHAKDGGYYHGTHIGQYLQLFAMTRDTFFARLAELYYTDFPLTTTGGTVMFGPGSHTGYLFDAGGRVLSRKELRLTRWSNAPATAREKVIRHEGLWYSISAGALAGYRVREVPSRTYLLGVHAIAGYRISRPVRLAYDGIRAYSINRRGSMTAVRTDFRAGDRTTVDARAVVNGVEHLRLDSGPYAGRWIGYPTVTRP